MKVPVLSLWCTLFLSLGAIKSSSQCNAPAGLTVVNMTTTSASFQWTSQNPPSVDHCWNIEVFAGSGTCFSGQHVFRQTVCTNSGAILVGPNTYQYTVTGLQPGTTLAWSLVETCDGNQGNSGSCSNALGPQFTTFDDPFVVTGQGTSPNCSFISPGYAPDGSLTVSIQDALTCPGGLYDIVVTPVAGSGPSGSTPPFTIPSVVFNATDAGSPYLFTNAGAGNYTVQVFELGLCNPQTNPEVIVVNVPDSNVACP